MPDFPTNPYKGQIFYDPESETVYEYFVPREDDYFDISGTTVTSDQSTTTVSANFTGNFVWVRAKVETTNATGNPSMISSILLNN